MSNFTNNNALELMAEWHAASLREEYSYQSMVNMFNGSVDSCSTKYCYTLTTVYTTLHTATKPMPVYET